MRIFSSDVFYQVFDLAYDSAGLALNGGNLIAASASKRSYTLVQAGEQISRANLKWGGSLGTSATVTYAFRSTYDGAVTQDTVNFTIFTTAQINQTISSIISWPDIANIIFIRKVGRNTGDSSHSNNATILFSNFRNLKNNNAGYEIFSFIKNKSSPSDDTWINVANQNSQIIGYGSDDAATITHEIGHAIGLRHHAEYNGGYPNYNSDAIYIEYSKKYTIMSYFLFPVSTNGTDLML